MFTIQSELLYSHAVFYCILQGIGTTSHAHAGQNARIRDAHDHHARVQARVCRASSCSHAGARIYAGHHARMHACIFVAAVLYACSTIHPMSSPIYVHMHVRVKCMLALIHSVFAAQSLQLPQKNSRHTSLDASVCRLELLQVAVSCLFGCSFAPMLMELENARALTALGERQARPEEPLRASLF